MRQQLFCGPCSLAIPACTWEFTIPEIFWPDYYGESLWDGVVFSYIRKCDLFSLAMFRLPIPDVVLWG